jgi:hypothetical protein
MTPTLQQKPESVGGSIPTEERIELARFHAQAAYRALLEFRNDWRERAQRDIASGKADMRAYWLWQFVDRQEGACAALELDAQERTKWQRVEASPEMWDAIDKGRGK